MRMPSGKFGTIATAAATPVAILAASALVWQSSYAAFTGTTRNSGNDWATGSVALTDDDAGSARLQVANMTPGQTDTKCITITASASGPGVVKAYLVNPVTSPQGLESRIKMTAGDGNASNDTTPVSRDLFRARATILVPFVGKPFIWWATGNLVPLLAWGLFTALCCVFARRRPRGPHNGAGTARRLMRLRSLPGSRRATPAPPSALARIARVVPVLAFVSVGTVVLTPP